MLMLRALIAILRYPASSSEESPRRAHRCLVMSLPARAQAVPTAPRETCTRVLSLDESGAPTFPGLYIVELGCRLQFVCRANPRMAPASLVMWCESCETGAGFSLPRVRARGSRVASFPTLRAPRRLRPSA